MRQKDKKNKTMEKKKPTNVQLAKRIERAIVHIDRTKDTKEIYFYDKGLRLIANEEVVVIETGFHQHVFHSITPNGYSRPYLYTKRFVEIALGIGNEAKVKTKDGWSYAGLLDELKKREDKTDYNFAWYVDLWLSNIFYPLYSIGESEIDSFLVYEDYLHNIARNVIILSEKKEDITNKEFVDKVIENIKKYIDGIEERIIFHKKTDEELVQEEIDALGELEQEQIIEKEAE